jgi:hypothetical protein
VLDIYSRDLRILSLNFLKIVFLEEIRCSSVHLAITCRKLSPGETDFCGEHESELSFSNTEALYE